MSEQGDIQYFQQKQDIRTAGKGSTISNVVGREEHAYSTMIFLQKTALVSEEKLSAQRESSFHGTVKRQLAKKILKETPFERYYEIYNTLNYSSDAGIF